ncbi:hypothetical protein B5X24_HaOG214821 [Helicoverpa armigera]|uniref:Uncharacterized protein n=1 Tax=Helicoverpa armigera TaxID=29058 RepID=A0A2W1B4C9_HELAM|nr:hypothetical protein B5X24_HaOG214821 [Helicoverpa armigera]
MQVSGHSGQHRRCRMVCGMAPHPQLLSWRWFAGKLPDSVPSFFAIVGQVQAGYGVHPLLASALCYCGHEFFAHTNSLLRKRVGTVKGVVLREQLCRVSQIVKRP